MIKVRRSAERGVTRRDWLTSYHTFSFGEYQDPAHEQYGPLRVLNDDYIAAGAGFPMHGHRDMEILTYVLSGAVEHRDSEGNHGIVRPFELQRMRAGSGIHHSEVNPNPNEPLHLLQIWLFPHTPGLKPDYEQVAFGDDRRDGRFVPAVTPDGREGSMEIATDATLYLAHLEPGQSAGLDLAAGRSAFLHVAAGAIELDGQRLDGGDAAAISEQVRIELRAAAGSELLLFDLVA